LRSVGVSPFTSRDSHAGHPMPVTFEIDPSRRTVRTVASGLVDALVRKGRFGALAIVTDSDFAFGIARMYQILTEPLPVQIAVFRNLDDATA
jgi:hypothetical protein